MHKVRTLGPQSPDNTSGVRGTHHIGQLCDGQLKMHCDRLRDVFHRPDESVVASEQCVEELLFRRTACAACVVHRGKHQGSAGVGVELAPPWPKATASARASAQHQLGPHLPGCTRATQPHPLLNRAYFVSTLR